MIQHFYDNNMSFLCCQPKDIKKRISILNDETIAEIKGLPSIARYLKTNSENPGNDKFKVHIIGFVINIAAFKAESVK